MKRCRAAIVVASLADSGRHSSKSLSIGSSILSVCHLFSLFFSLIGMMFPLICLIQSHDSIPAMGSKALEITHLLFSPFLLEIVFCRGCLCWINVIALSSSLHLPSRRPLHRCATACRSHRLTRGSVGLACGTASL